MTRWLWSAAYVSAVLALLVGVAWLRGQPEEDLPPGSSHSSQFSGTRALYLWLEAQGARPERLEAPDSALRGRAAVLLVIEPLVPVLPTTRPAFDAVPERGGALVLAGDSPSLWSYTHQLGLRFAPLAGGRTGTLASPPGGRGGAATDRLLVRMDARRHILPDGQLQPELVAPGGEWLAASKAYGRGKLVVFTSARPFTNEGLRDADTARYVYGLLTSRLGAAPAGPYAPASRPVVLFDEAHRAVPGSGGGPGTPEGPLEQRIFRWVLGTSVGGAAVYGLTLVFLYLLLTGRRLGPPLRAVSPGPTAGEQGEAPGGPGLSRTMYEHVQALAGLYRRARQLPYLRAHYARHYRRRLARIAGTDAPVARPGPLDAAELARFGIAAAPAARAATAVAGVEAARTERQLVRAVRDAEAALAVERATARGPAVAPR